MNNIGIEANTPFKKLEVKGYNWFDTILIKLIVKYFDKKSVSVSFYKVSASGAINPAENLHIFSSGNIGISV